MSPPPADAGALPEAPQLGRKRPAPNRRTALTREAIVTAAVATLDSGGVGALTMRAVAGRLGTGPASLYAHVSGKEQLLELVYDELIGRVSLPDPDPDHWADQLRQMMRDLLAQLVAHRDAALGGLGRIPTTPNALAATEALTAVMRAGKLTDPVIALGIDQLILYVSAVALEQTTYRAPEFDAEQLAQYFAQVHEFYQRLPVDRFPVLTAVAAHMTGHDGATRFEFGLSVLIAGFQAVTSHTP